MPSFVGFLRAVNVGRRRYPMVELRAALDAAGFTDVETHIQTGNVRVTTPKRSAHVVAAELARVFEADRGFEVPTIVLTPAELDAVVADADELARQEAPPGFGHYVELLRAAPDPDSVALIEGRGLPGQRAVVCGRAVHLLYDVAFHEAKGPNAAVRRAMGESTNRNLTVLRALAEKWGNLRAG